MLAAKRNRKKRNLVRFVRNVLALVLLVELIAALFTTPHLAIRRFEIHGARMLSAGDIISVSGVRAGQNILTLRKSLIESRIRILPMVQDVHVHRKMPKTVRIIIRERTPYAVVSAGNFGMVIDRGLVPFKSAEPFDFSRLPIIEIPPTRTLRLGKKIDSPYVVAGVECLRLSSRYFPKAKRVSVDAYLNVCLNMEAFRIRLGQPTQLREKLAVARDLLDARPAIVKVGEYLDVSSPNCPAWKPREEAPNVGDTVDEGHKVAVLNGPSCGRAI